MSTTYIDESSPEESSDGSESDLTSISSEEPIAQPKRRRRVSKCRVSTSSLVCVLKPSYYKATASEPKASKKQKG